MMERKVCRWVQPVGWVDDAQLVFENSFWRTSTCVMLHIINMYVY